MNAAQLYVETIKRSDETLLKALEGLTVEELRAQPAGPGSNPIGWLIWHLTRSRDNITAHFAEQPSVWEQGGWAPKFGFAGEPPRFTPEDVHTFDPVSYETLMGYYRAVAERTEAVVSALSEGDLDRMIPPQIAGRPAMKLGSRLGVILNDNIQHIGQVAYLRGLLRGHGWF